MWRFYLKLIVFIVPGLFILSTATRQIGTAQSYGYVLRGFIKGCEDKSRPCWYGIMPSITTAEDGKNLIETERYNRTANTSFTSSYLADEEGTQECKKAVFLQGGMPNGDFIVYTIILSECSGIRSGDLMSIFQTPSFVSLNMPMLFYGTNGVTTSYDRASRWDTSPFAEIESIRLQFGNQWEILPWNGFVPRWKRCQAEQQTVPGC